MIFRLCFCILNYVFKFNCKTIVAFLRGQGKVGVGCYGFKYNILIMKLLFGLRKVPKKGNNTVVPSNNTLDFPPAFAYRRVGFLHQGSNVSIRDVEQI